MNTGTKIDDVDTNENDHDLQELALRKHAYSNILKI